MKRIGRLSLLPVVLGMNLFIKLLNCALDFAFDDMPEYWHWALHGEFKHMSSEDYAPLDNQQKAEEFDRISGIHSRQFEDDGF